MSRVKHNHQLAEALAQAAEMRSPKYLKQMARDLARELDVDLPRCNDSATNTQQN